MFSVFSIDFGGLVVKFQFYCENRILQNIHLLCGNIVYFIIGYHTPMYANLKISDKVNNQIVDQVKFLNKMRSL